MTSSEIPSVPIGAVPAVFDGGASEDPTWLRKLPPPGPPGAPQFDGAGPPTAMLLDVREDDEWQLGHAPNAVHIPMADIPARIEELDYDTEIYVVCRQGGRSMQVVQYLTHVGFDAVNVAGGMVAWQKAGRPLTADGGHEAKIY